MTREQWLAMLDSQEARIIKAANQYAKIVEEEMLKKLQDEMVQEIDREVINQMILNDPGSKECKDLQKKKHIQEIKDAAKEYEL